MFSSKENIDQPQIDQPQAVRIEAVTPDELGLEKVGISKVPAPFFIGRVNAYVIFDEPIALIDTGISSDRAKEGLLGGLKELGVEPADIGRLIITHGHQDHCGMAAMLKRMNPSMETIVPAMEAAYFEQYFDEFNRILDYSDREYHLCGFEPSLADAISAIRKGHFDHSASFEVSRKVDDGDVIDFSGLKLAVMRTPGHTSGSISLYYKDEDAIFTGDFLYRSRIPSPYLEPPPEGQKFKAAISGFSESLERVKAHGIKFILGGHGDIITRTDKFFSRMIEHVENKKAEILGVLEEDPCTLAQIHNRFNEKMDPDSVMIQASDIFSYLEDFRASGEVERNIDNGAAVYRRAG